jgi:deoxyadenosine/deoxycytidine kinase
VLKELKEKRMKSKPKLIIINGPAGIGKSTTSSILHMLLPFSFLIEVDVQRRFISQYRNDLNRSTELVWSMVYGMVEAYLREG